MTFPTKRKPSLKQIEASMDESVRLGFLTCRVDPQTGEKSYQMTDAGRARIEKMMRREPKDKEQRKAP